MKTMKNCKEKLTKFDLIEEVDAIELQGKIKILFWK